MIPRRNDENPNKATVINRDSTEYVSISQSGIAKVIKTDDLMTKGNVGLGLVDNTSDAGKPVSDAQNTINNSKADKTAVDTKNDLQDTEIINRTANYNSVEFIATSGQTEFTSDYTVGYIDVYKNGIKLGLADFVATNGSLITLTLATDLDDIISIKSLKTEFLIADAYTQGQVDGLVGNEVTRATEAEQAIVDCILCCTYRLIRITSVIYIS